MKTGHSFNVGDIVYMPQDKFQEEIWGFITSINQKWATIRWFDGKESEEDIAWLNKIE